MKVALSLAATIVGVVATPAADQTGDLMQPIAEVLASRQVDAAAIEAVASGTLADLARILAEHEISAGLVFATPPGWPAS